MEEFDDYDFSELYADVEVQACSAINFMHGLTQVSPGNDGVSDNAVEKKEMDCETRAENGRNHNNVTGSENGENVRRTERESRSESEEDLNIVLNDDDDNGGEDNYDLNNNPRKNEREGQIDDEEKNGNGNGSSGQGQQHGNAEKGKGLNSHPQRKYTEPYSAPFSSNLKDSCSIRGDWKDNEYIQLMHGCPIVAQIRNNFSLPRSRTILDINIDSLVKKPWRHPGADVTDFFNFGFDEESWKHYHNLEKSLDQIMMANRTAVHKLPKHMKDFEAVSGHEEVSQASVAKNIAQSRPTRRVSLGSKTYDRDQQSELANGRSNQADDNVGRHQQDLKEDSLNSSMKTVDRTVSQLHETCENGDIAMEDDTGRLHFNRAIEDEPPSLEGNDEGRGKTTSERYSRCIPAHDPASLDLDKYGRVQISDSEEDNHYEVSICDSDRISQAMETSDSTIKSYKRNISDKTPSTAEPESSDSGQSRRAPSSSPRHCEGLSDDDLGKRRKHSKILLPNPVSKLRESVTCDYHSTKDPKTRNIKTDFRHNRYFRSKEPIRKDLLPRRRSEDPSKLKTHLNDEDGSHVSYAKGISDLHHSTVGHDKLSCTLDNFDSNVRKDTFYCRGSDHFATYFDGVFPDYQFGPAYMKNRCWNIHPSFGYEPGCYDSRDMNVKQTFIKGKQSKVDNAAVDEDRYHGRKHAVRDINSRGFEESRHFIPKLPAYMENGGCTQFNWKGDGMQFKRRIKGGVFIPVHNYKKNFVHGKHRRFMPIGDRDSDHVEYKDDRELPYNGRKIKSPGRRGEWRCDRPLNGFDNSGHADSDDNDGRCISRPPLSYKKPQAPRGGRYQGATGPKSGVPERPGRHMRCSRTDRFRESGRFGSYNNAFETDGDMKDLHGQDHFVRKRHYQQSIDAFDSNEGIKNHHNHDHFVRRRHYQQSEVLDWNEEEYTSRQQDDAVFHSKEPSYPRFSKHINSDATRGSDCVVKLRDKRQVNRRRYKLKRESKHGCQFNQSSNFIHPENSGQTHPRNRDSVEPNLVVRERKLSRRRSEAGCTMSYGRHDYMDWNSDPEQETPTGLNDFGSEKAALAKTEKADTNQGDKSWNDKFPDTQQNGYLDIEEGQIISEEINEKSAEREIASEHMTRANSTEHTGTASNGNTVVHGLDDLRIQEIIAKMEKRRERFKDPITSNKDAVKPSNHLMEFDTGTAATRLKRPARKRKWVRN